ncbi:MAG: DUF285 domain-containing protein [Coriobacteriia bacterium]|nr:DUF285 domain-containing protein [Coriobacteriia bacterium]
MANPFLVLGGIAVGIISAGFGILQVPGWIASAQNAAAVNDLSGIRAAEAAAVSVTGAYAGDFRALDNPGLGVKFTPSSGLALPAISLGDHTWCATVKSESGTYWSTSAASTSYASGATPEAAASAAGCAATPAPVPPAPRISFTLNSPTTQAVGLPLVGATGTVTWSDGVTTGITGGIPDKRNLTAGVQYKVTFDGTFNALDSTGAGLSLNEDAAFRSVDAWTGDTKTTSMFRAFSGMLNLTSVPAEIPSGITNLDQTFYQATNFNSDISGWDTSNVTTLHETFMLARSFNQPIGGWKTSKVTDMSWAFSRADVFNRPLAAWDTSHVTTMEQALSGALAFNQPLNSWDMSSVTTTSGMFYSANSFNQPLNSWNTFNVTQMGDMFGGALVFNGDISNWDTRNVTVMSGMFASAGAFNQPLASWNTGNVNMMAGMFAMASTFNQPLAGWNTSNVTNMNSMFFGAAAFSQDLTSWNTSKVTSGIAFYSGSKLTAAQLPARVH